MDDPGWQAGWLTTDSRVDEARKVHVQWMAAATQLRAELPRGRHVVPWGEGEWWSRSNTVTLPKFKQNRQEIIEPIFARGVLF